MDSLENELLPKLKTGDTAVYEMTFRKYYEPLCNYAYTYLQDRDDAEEIVQAVFLSVWEKRASLNIHTSVRSYLYTMVRNAALNALKHEKIKRKHAAETLALASVGADTSTQQVVAGELEDRIREALDRLPEQCRLIFSLSRFEELRYAEIAQHLNLSVKTVENQMGKALRIMRDELKDYLPLILLMLHWIING